MLARQNLASLFSGLVVIVFTKHPIPSRTRKLRVITPMVLHLKVWESRSLPNLIRDLTLLKRYQKSPQINILAGKPQGSDAGWSSPVARQAHNLKAAGSNPAPATNLSNHRPTNRRPRGGVCVFGLTLPLKPMDEAASAQQM